MIDTKKQIGKCILDKCIRTGFNHIENTEYADFEFCRNCVFLKDKEIMKEAKDFVNNCVIQHNITENVEELLYNSFLHGAKKQIPIIAEEICEWVHKYKRMSKRGIMIPALKKELKITTIKVKTNYNKHNNLTQDIKNLIDTAFLTGSTKQRYISVDKARNWLSDYFHLPLTCCFLNDLKENFN